ncbi:MAG: hypothetical protein J5895_00960 [Alphaproteobacteria bacterium]|nr:hypothetical protein [Alphaproteobacteria bacterium]
MVSVLKEYSKLLNKTRGTLTGDEWLKYKTQTKELLFKANRLEVYRILRQTENLQNNWLKSWVYNDLPFLYKKHKPLRSEIIKMLESAYQDNLARFYQKTSEILAASSKKEHIEHCFKLMEEFIKSNENTAQTLSVAFLQFENLARTNPQYGEQIKNLIKLGAQNKNNDRKSLDDAFFALQSIRGEKINRYMSRIVLGQRVHQSDEFPEKWKDVQKINPDEACLIVLPGNATFTPRAANHYLSCFEELISRKHDANTACLYAAAYDFGSYFKSDVAQTILFEKHHRLKLEKTIENTEPENVSPTYINEIYEKVFKNRLSNGKDERLPLDKALKNINRVVVFAHCFGAYTFLKLEEKIDSEMKALKYSKHERAKIFQNLFCVAYEPYAPLGVSKSTMLSFVSANDKVIHAYNHMEEYVKQLSKANRFKTAFFEGKRGNVLIAPKIHATYGDHNYFGMNITADLTSQGSVVMRLMENAITNAVALSCHNVEKTDLRRLMTGGNIELENQLDAFQKEGQTLWQDIKTNFKTNLPILRAYTAFHTL